MENQQQYSVHVHGPLDLFKELIKGRSSLMGHSTVFRSLQNLHLECLGMVYLKI